MSSSSSSSSAPTTKLAGGEEFHLMYWCHECDMSIHLLPSTSSNNSNGNSTMSTNSVATTSPTCPQCDLGFLELMDTGPSVSTLDFLHLDSPTFRSCFFPKQSAGDDDDDQDGGSPDDRSFFSYFRGLPTVRIGEETNEEVEGSLPCAVCREQFGVEEEAKRLPCGHLFHGECILPWLSSGHLSCPLCRFQLLTDPPRSEEDEEGSWFLCLQSFFASSSSTSSSSAADNDSTVASTSLPTSDSR